MNSPAENMEGTRILKDDNLRRYCLNSGWSIIAAVGDGDLGENWVERNIRGDARLRADAVVCRA
jgi:hypothetical protein